MIYSPDVINITEISKNKQLFNIYLILLDIANNILTKTGEELHVIGSFLKTPENTYRGWETEVEVCLSNGVSVVYSDDYIRYKKEVHGEKSNGIYYGIYDRYDPKFNTYSEAKEYADKIQFD